MSNLTLYQLTESLLSLQELANDPSIPEEALADTLEGLEGTLAVKAQNIAYVIQNMGATAEAIKLAARKMTDRAERMEEKQRWLKDYVKSCMEASGMTKIECTEFKLSIRKTPVAVEVNDGEQIPDEFWYQPPPPERQLDKKKLKEYLETLPEKAIDGVRLIQRTRLSID